VPEERKLVTILFADIVGSTALGLEHDPEVVRAALRRTFEALRDLLVAHGGTVEKFIGDAVMAVFGVPLAHDDDADRAVRCAFALRSRIAQLNETARIPLDLRVGVNTGEAVAGSGEGAQFLVTGAPVNASARLQTGAAPGEILVGALTRQLTGGGVRYGERREVAAKGIGRLEAWPALQLLSEVPEPHRGFEHLSAPLIGRDRELRILTEARERVRETRAPALVTVFGPAGAGKSRLIKEFIAAIGHRRVRVGRCLPYGEGITFFPLRLILNTECGIDLTDDHGTAHAKLQRAVAEVREDADEARAIVSRIATLAGLAPPGATLPGVPENDLAEELRWGVRRFFELRAGSEPLVLVFEDVHWAETRLVQLVEHLAEWSRAPLLLVCLARPDFHEEHPTFGSSAVHATSVTLGPLGSDETQRLVRELLATDALPESLRAEVVTRSDGNPLYVEEFLRMLIETKRIAQSDGQWVAVADHAQLDVPPTLIGLITARLDRVRPEVKRLLQRAAIVGRLFSSTDLEAMGGEPVRAELLHEAERRDLLSVAGERPIGNGRLYRFRHVLIRDVAYSTVPKVERAPLHDNYSRWLERSSGDRKDEIAESIAFHAEQAFVLGHEVELKQAGDLGRRALGLLLAAATTARLRDDPFVARKLYARAALVADRFKADPMSRAEAHGFAGLYRANHEPRTPERDAAFAAAYTVAAMPGPSEVLLELTARRAFLEVEDDRAAAANDSYDEVIRIAEATGDPELIGTALVARAFGSYMLGDLEGYNAELVQARDYLAATGATRALARCLGLLVGAARQRGEFSQASRYQVERRAALPPYLSKLQQATMAWNDAGIAYEIGDFGTALREAELAVATGREAGVPRTIGFGLWFLGDALIELGDSARARRVLEEGIAIFEAREARPRLPEVHSRCARACIRLGDLTAAREHVAAAQQHLLPGDATARQITGVARAELVEAEGDLAAADAAWRDTLANLPSSGFAGSMAWTELLFGSFLLRHAREAEGRAQLNAARARYRDPLAYRRVAEIDTLLAEVGVSASGR
jgi:class 3 adenylate cyclase/tetratricopeptide (TPR) repeat protein